MLLASAESLIGERVSVDVDRYDLELSPSTDVELQLIRWTAQLRMMWSVAGVVSTVAQRRVYRRPNLAIVTCLVALGESVWSRSRSSRRDDDPAAIVANVVGTASLIAVSTAVGPEDQFGGLVDWAFHSMLWTSGSTAFRMPSLTRGLAVTTASVATYAQLISWRTGGAERSRAWINGGQLAAFYFSAAVLSRSLRSSDRAILDAQRTAVDEAARGAEERARTRAFTEMHSGALDVLDAVRSSWRSDERGARRLAAAEASRLRHLVEGTRPHGGLGDSLSVVASDLARQGARVDLILDLEHPIDDEIGEQLHRASVVVVMWLLRSATPLRLVIRAVDDDQSVELSFRLRSQEPDGDLDDLRSRLQDLLDPIDGSCAISSPQGPGLRINVRVDW